MTEAGKKAMQHPDKLGAGAAKRKSLPAKDKKDVVMAEFHRGTLHSGSGEKVTNPKQAVAIAYSEAGEAKKKHFAKHLKKAHKSWAEHPENPFNSQRA
jgi:hypothetical protein